ncbi:MAG: alpha/beta hydrolase-fold protein [Chitinophagales bacterium]
MLRFYILVSCFPFFVRNISGQTNNATPIGVNNVFTLGLINQIHSAALAETRTLNIYLPESYSHDSTKMYPVIYLLDGSANEDFIHVVGIVQFLIMIEAMPEAIVVGIANVDRRRDFTFPTTIEKDKKDFPTTGGSAKFMSFIGNELQPFIQKNYRCNTVKTIIGQSLGGLFATEVLFKNPDLFDNYIIVSPSLWWDNESLLALSPGVLNSKAVTLKQVYISVGSEGKQMEEDAKKLGDLMEEMKMKNVKVIYVPLPEEDHLTILHNSVYKAFELLNVKK